MEQLPRDRSRWQCALASKQNSNDPTIKRPWTICPRVFFLMRYLPTLLDEHYLPNLFAEHGIVARSSHWEQHREREHEAGARREECLPGQIFCLVRDRRAAGCLIGRPADDFLLSTPHYAPDVE